MKSSMIGALILVWGAMVASNNLNNKSHENFEWDEAGKKAHIQKCVGTVTAPTKWTSRRSLLLLLPDRGGASFVGSRSGAAGAAGAGSCAVAVRTCGRE